MQENNIALASATPSHTKRGRKLFVIGLLFFFLIFPINSLTDKTCVKTSSCGPQDIIFSFLFIVFLITSIILLISGVVVGLRSEIQEAQVGDGKKVFSGILRFISISTLLIPGLLATFVAIFSFIFNPLGGLVAFATICILVKMCQYLWKYRSGVGTIIVTTLTITLYIISFALNSTVFFDTGSVYTLEMLFPRRFANLHSPFFPILLIISLICYGFAILYLRRILRNKPDLNRKEVLLLTLPVCILISLNLFLTFSQP